MLMFFLVSLSNHSNLYPYLLHQSYFLILFSYLYPLMLFGLKTYLILPILAVLHCMTYHVQKIFDLRLITIVGMQEIFLILPYLTYQVVYLPCLPYVIPHVYIF